jgi:hypothetical protein
LWCSPWDRRGLRRSDPTLRLLHLVLVLVILVVILLLLLFRLLLFILLFLFIILTFIILVLLFVLLEFTLLPRRVIERMWMSTLLLLLLSPVRHWRKSGGWSLCPSRLSTFGVGGSMSDDGTVLVELHTPGERPRARGRREGATGGYVALLVIRVLF